MVAAISPQGLAGLNSVIDMANVTASRKTPASTCATIFFGNLGDDIINYQKAPVGDSLPALSAPPALTLIGTANPDQMIQSIKIVASMVSPQTARRNRATFAATRYIPSRCAPSTRPMAAPFPRRRCC